MRTALLYIGGFVAVVFVLAVIVGRAEAAPMRVVVQDNAVLLNEKRAPRAAVLELARDRYGATGVQVDAFYCDWRRHGPARWLEAARAARAHGLGVRVRLAPSPGWCAQGDALNATSYAPAPMRAYAAEVAETLAPYTRDFTIGNEPNHPLFNVSRSPRRYRALYLAGLAGVRSAVPRARVWLGETAAGGDIEAFYRGVGRFSRAQRPQGLAHHPYESGVDPMAPAGRSAARAWRISRIDRCVSFARRVYRAPCHVSEFGYRASEPRQAWLLERALERARRAGVRSFTIYQVVRQPDEKWNTGLVDWPCETWCPA